MWLKPPGATGHEGLFADAVSGGERIHPEAYGCEPHGLSYFLWHPNAEEHHESGPNQENPPAGQHRSGMQPGQDQSDFGSSGQAGGEKKTEGREAERAKRRGTKSPKPWVH